VAGRPPHPEAAEAGSRRDGDLIEPHLRREGLERAELEMVVREHGVDSLSDVKLAVLETDGSIRIVPMASRVVRTRKRVRQLRRR
jgi:uncharacterized membrane protein YcaP (DUF421 family)